MEQRLESSIITPVIALVSLVFCCGAAAPPERLLPNTTRAFIAVDDARKLEDAWKKTQWGQLASDPLMKEFVDDVKRHFQNTVVPKLETGTGTTIDELRKVATGELAGAIVEVSQAGLATVMIIDATGNGAQAQALIKQAGSRLTQRGATQKSIEQYSTTIQTWTWVSDETEKHAAWFLQDDVLVYSSSVDAIKDILARWKTADESLHFVAAFRDCMESCKANDIKTSKLRWFVDPVALLRLTYKPGPFDEPKDHPAEFARRHGLDAVKGIAGTVTGATAQHDLVLRVAIHAPKPYRKTMSIFDFPSDKYSQPHSWIPNDVNMVMSLDFNLMAGFDNIGWLFDDLYADGIEGTFNDIMNDLKASDGPRVDVRKDLIENLGTRITVLNDTIPPVAGKNERSLVAVAIKQNEPSVAQAVKRMLRDDPGVKRYRLPGYDNDLWTIGESGDREEEEGAPRFRSIAVMVARNQLMISTNVNLIRKVLTHATSSNVFDSDDVRTVMASIDSLGVHSTIGRAFSRLDRDFETTYELIRTQRADEFESIYGLFAGMIVKRFEDSQTGKQTVDFQKLPKFEDIRKYFGLAGVVGENLKDGWLVTVFTLSGK